MRVSLKLPIFRKQFNVLNNMNVFAKNWKTGLGEGSACGKLGDTYNTIGNVDKALNFFQKQLEIATEVGDKKSEGSACASLSSVFFGLGKIFKAYKYCERHAECAHRIGGQGWRRTCL